jgi:hypothetical protein
MCLCRNGKPCRAAYQQPMLLLEKGLCKAAVRTVCMDNVLYGEVYAHCMYETECLIHLLRNVVLKLTVNILWGHLSDHTSILFSIFSLSIISLFISLSIYVYIYIYISVCLCVCVCLLNPNSTTQAPTAPSVMEQPDSHETHWTVLHL